MKKPSVLVTGRSSFLALSFIKAAAGTVDVTQVARIDTDGIGSKTFDAVVNFACDPAYFTDDYDSSLDVDAVLSEQLKGRFGHYFMLSSRLVYGRTESLAISEDRTKNPQGPYGRNKAVTEDLLLDRLGSGLTVLRLANVFGAERKRRTFAGVALESLKTKGEIVLDIAPSTRRDFLPARDFAQALTRLVAIRPGGVFNLGSGHPTPVGDIANWFVQGYGVGRVRVTAEQPSDEFCLDITAVKKLVGDITTPGAIERQAIEAGRSLQHA
tara:strand:- start:5662 stop:6468 length:807 start_codon:yes stop_codon:yes gene_type:complete